MARQYESVCAGAKHAASVSGLLLWLDEQAKGEGDSLALPAIDAVQVMTHHKAKGLEWPIVVMMDIQGDVKDGLWNSLRAGSRRTITAADPLRERTLRLWPWPFGKQQKLPFRDEISRTPIAQYFQKVAIEEAKRVLYVSMTRARDLMVFALPAKSPSGPWMETLDCADPSILTPRRNSTLTPLQALSLMNSRFVLAQSRHLAQRIEALTPSREEQLKQLITQVIVRGDVAAAS